MCLFIREIATAWAFLRGSAYQKFLVRKMKANFVCYKAQQLKLSLWVCSFACRTHQVSGVVTRTINAGFPCPKTLKYCIKRSILSAFNLGIFAYTWNLYLLYYVVVNCFVCRTRVLELNLVSCVYLFIQRAQRQISIVFSEEKKYIKIYIYFSTTRKKFTRTHEPKCQFISAISKIFFTPFC